MNDPKEKPAQTIRIGALSVSIWRKHSEAKTVSGRSYPASEFYSVKASRAYLVKRDAKFAGAWEYADSFGFDDLLTLSKLFDLAHTWIIRDKAKSKTPADGQ